MTEHAQAEVQHTLNGLNGGLRSQLLELAAQPVCLPAWQLGTVCILLALATLCMWLTWRRAGILQSQLEQIGEDSHSLTELFTSEVERLRRQLMKTKEDSEGLDDILGSLLREGLPCHLELVSKDYWCVRTMTVTYTDHAGCQKSISQSGYHISCFVPGGSRDIEVTFSVVGGSSCKKVDRSQPGWPYIYDEDGNTQQERFHFSCCPGTVKFEAQGPSWGSFISHVAKTEQVPTQALNALDSDGHPALAFRQRRRTLTS
eukprot:TRINITY_DN49211_c0_g1_i1.p2 TRINITY_DN49211_c0_g1~~TRINITY_DN49211_c0_g1_i1.p2  ORF type:complete len:259 (+),score=54.23 TRINITY_DN49211_c0_g1_i1:162-938(+)